MSDKRVRTRIDFKTLADVRAAGADLQEVETRDLSHKGVFLVGDHPLEMGTECVVDIHLLPEEPDAPNLHMKGRVARKTPDGVAIDFTSMDADTFLHLRNLLMLNADDPEAIEKEFTTSAFGNEPDDE